MDKLKKIISQMFRFGIIGVISTAIDFALLYLFTNVFRIYYLLSATLSFSLSLIFNYIFNMRFVFKRKEHMKRQIECIVFVLLSLIGLGINAFLMWILVEYIHVFYMAAKVLATAVVMVWNFVSRKVFLEDRAKE